MIERLETERLILRKPAARDWEMGRDFFMSERAKGIGGPYEEGRAWLIFAAEIGHWEIRGYGMFAVTRKGEDRALGLIGPWVPSIWPETEVGWTIWDPSVEGTGIATEAARACVLHAYRDLGWSTVVSYIAPDNHRSIRLAEKLGAVHDVHAKQPMKDKPSLVYRHPRPADERGAA
ncbi:GNAT family N-acetyltransferase [Histidinibacterium aquaticum]|uniref:GNAT family N-acetyltransferase n=1 Tax=Histidinibacterium aquaticum TaxID=2613962 RepID=A0A5J5GSE9_9RHOB|nr:GNAT family N-acetyltransferase [Histidinibacterium aquaticum]KAA9010593.1 GNAT family N-acetyltransferase [Histidinibacterium aquaticum]